MLLNCSKIIGLKVYTKSGGYLGKVKDIELDLANYYIVSYLVVNEKLLRRWYAPALVISRTQVLSIDEQKMVVEDALAPVASALAKAPSA